MARCVRPADDAVLKPTRLSPPTSSRQNHTGRLSPLHNDRILPLCRSTPFKIGAQGLCFLDCLNTAHVAPSSRFVSPDCFGLRLWLVYEEQHETMGFPLELPAPLDRPALVNHVRPRRLRPVRNTTCKPRSLESGPRTFQQPSTCLHGRSTDCHEFLCIPTGRPVHHC